MVATVQAIDVTNQLVTVVGPNNNWVVVKVKPEHIKLIKLKERITISYANEVAVALRKVDGPPTATEDPFAKDELAGMNMNAPTVAEQDWVEATPHGATDLTTIEITDTVAAINRNQRTITFAGTGGKTRTIFVGPAFRASTRSRSATGSCCSSPGPWPSISGRLSSLEGTVRRRAGSRASRASSLRVLDCRPIATS